MDVVWRSMDAIKLNILQRLDVAPIPVRICCIKFIQKVIQIQTPGQIADPRVRPHVPKATRPKTDNSPEART